MRPTRRVDVSVNWSCIAIAILTVAFWMGTCTLVARWWTGAE